MTHLTIDNLILPYFVVEGKNVKRPIKSMPGICHLSVDNLIKDLKELKGIKYILLFGLTKTKDEKGLDAYKTDGVVQRAVREVKNNFPKLVVITDVCLCAYTSHGHCRILRKQKSEVRKQKNLSSDFCRLSSDNNATLKVLAKIALSHAQAGADFVAPSAMMPGQVKAIRSALDKEGFKKTKILSYSAKYASSFYGPFREALNSAPRFGDRKSYQLDFEDSNNALRKIEQDIKEGADIVMVKPALAYLDIIRRAKDKFNVPLAAYNVSGEYAMISYWLMANSLWQRNKSHQPSAISHQLRRDLVLEILTAIKRAGADLIISYHAKEVASWLMANSL